MADVMFIEAPYKGEIKLSKEALKLLSKCKRVSLFTSVQFLQLDSVKKQLNEAGIKVLTTKAKRASQEVQILGCDCFESSFKDKGVFKADALLYIGDGMFHPKALLLAQRDFDAKDRRDVIVFNPLSDSAYVMTHKDVEKQLKKYKANMLRYMHAKKVGILVSVKSGQHQLAEALKLLEKKGKEKEFYLFAGDSISLSEMENFNFIEAWVNTACPRVGFDDITNTSHAVINVKDALEI